MQSIYYEKCLKFHSLSQQEQVEKRVHISRVIVSKALYCHLVFHSLIVVYIFPLSLSSRGLLFVSDFVVYPSFACCCCCTAASTASRL